jgi:anionic cell wall polymer biosynthesis LytR-Cps2A-Psr (LCP) family protein
MKRNIWLFVASAGLALVAVGLVSFYLIYGKIVVKPNAAKINPAVSPTATPTPDPLAAYSILLMGYGGGAHEGGLLTDSMMVVRIEPHIQKITMISIPRDLWVPIPISGTTEIDSKINAAYAIGSDDQKYPDKAPEFTGPAGGGELAKAVVSQVVGFKIDYFAALDFDGFIKVINNLGGVDINVPRAFDDPWYPIESSVGIGDTDTCGKSDADVKALTATISGDKLEQQFTCRYDPLHFDKGVQHMDGATVLKYARSRHSPTEGGDFNRAARQRQVILAVKDKVINLGFITKIGPTINTLTKNLTTDVDFGEMNKLLGNALELAKYKIVPVALTDQNVLEDAVSNDGQDMLVPRIGQTDWSEVQQYIADPTMIIPTLTPQPTPTTKTSD